MAIFISDCTSGGNGLAAFDGVMNMTQANNVAATITIISKERRRMILPFPLRAAYDFSRLFYILQIEIGDLVSAAIADAQKGFADWLQVI